MNSHGHGIDKNKNHSNKNLSGDGNGEEIQNIEGKLLKDLQRKFFDHEKNFRTFCQKVNIDSMRKEIVEMNENISVTDKNNFEEMKFLSDKISKKLNYS